MISLEEAKEILRVDGADNDSIIAAIIESLPALIETQTGMTEIRQRSNKVVKQLEGLYLRQFYFGVEDTKLSRSIDSLLRIISFMAVEGVDYVDKVITENGVYLAADDNADGFSSVSVEVPNPALMSRNITANGTYCCQDETQGAAYGYDTVVVDVQPELEPLAVTRNGVYEPTVQGFEKVVVDVPAEANLGSKLITSPGEYSALLDGLDGFDKVIVDIDTAPILEALEARENGLYQVPEGLDGWNIVSVDVPEVELKPLAVTQNGTYEPEPGKGFGSVSVNVSAESGEVDSEWLLNYVHMIEGTNTSIVIPEGTTQLKDTAFANCSKAVGTVTIPDDIKTIPTNCFLSCSGISEFILPDTVKTIKMGAFNGCSGWNTKLVLPSQLTELGQQAFYSCSSLIGDVEIPVGVTSLGIMVFGSCGKVDNFIIRRTESLITLTQAGCFNYTKVSKGEAYIYVPDELVDSYKTATNWSTYANVIKPLSEYTGGAA